MELPKTCYLLLKKKVKDYGYDAYGFKVGPIEFEIEPIMVTLCEQVAEDWKRGSTINDQKDFMELSISCLN